MQFCIWANFNIKGFNYIIINLDNKEFYQNIVEEVPYIQKKF